VGRESGQASIEYAGVLGLVAAVLAAAGTAGGLDGVGRAVASGLRTGVCIVAGDVCRASDAEAAGLEPCTVHERSRGSAGTVVLASVRLGGGGEWTVASRSDGSVLVTETEDRAVGASAGLGVEASPLGIEVGVEGRYELVLGSGRTWELPDAEAARRFLAAPAESRPPPTWRFGQADTVLAGGLVADAAGVELTGVETSVHAAAGARVGRGRTTLYFRGRVDGPGAWLWTPAGTRRAPGPTTGDVVVELTRERGRLRELAFRTVGPGGRTGEVVETVGRLDLRSPANRAAVDPLLRRRAPWPPAVARDLRAAALRTVQAGTVERAVYGVREDAHELDVELRLGVALGIDVERVDVERRLLEASAWTPGSRERERVDCE
jgi:Flp pilus assembly pilin Flp